MLNFPPTAGAPQAFEGFVHHLVVFQKFPHFLGSAACTRAIRCILELLMRPGSSSSFGVIESMRIRYLTILVLVTS